MSRNAKLPFNCPPVHARQSGVALFVTIVMVTVILIVASTLAYRHELNSVRNSQAMVSEQAILLALSAESWAKSILLDDLANNNTDSLQDDWARVIPVLPVEGGTMTGCMVDMQSKYNLNNLGFLDQEDYENALNEPEDDLVEAYLGIREYIGLDAFPDHAAVIVDWIDADTDLIVTTSAEDSEYSLETPPRLTANAQLTSLSELVSVSGYSLVDVLALEDYVVALPAQTTINVNTAPIGVMQGLSTLIDGFVVEGLIENRPYDDTGAFYQALEDETGMPQSQITQQLPTSLFGVSSNFFELRAQVQIGGENIALTSLFQRNGRNDIRTISRSLQFIPELILEDDDINPLRPLCAPIVDDEDIEEPI